MASGTTADNMKRTLGGSSSLSIGDQLNVALVGDIEKYGYGTAIIKNWGQPKDSVAEAERRHYGALPTESLQDAKLRYYSGQSSSLDFVSDTVYDKVQGTP